MAISTSCPNCGATLQFDDFQASRQGSCPNCGTTFTIPGAPNGGGQPTGGYTGAAPTPPPGPAFGGPGYDVPGGSGAAPGNPFATSAAPGNPYAAGTAYSPPPSGHYAPHRGGVILTLGILGLLLCFIFGIFAWVMGSDDLQKMRSGKMDPSGYGVTQAGMICGMVATLIAALGLIVAVLSVVFSAF